MAKKILKEKVLRYTAVFEPQVEGGFSVAVPALPGCISEGDTFEEAATNIKEAIELYLEGGLLSELETASLSPMIVAPIEISIKSR